MDYSKNLLYFTGKKSTDLMILGGILCGILAFLGVAVFANAKGSNSPIPIVVGCVLLALGGWAVLAGMQKWPVSDSDYDKAVKDYLSNLKSIALDKLGVDESEVSEVAPIILGGYEFEGVDRVKKGEDGKWRSNIYKVVALFFSPHELHGYTMRFNTLRDEKTEGTDVYFYQDIVSASTSSLTIKTTVDGKEITVNPEAFNLTTKGGTSFTVNLLDSAYGQQSVKAMRALLREKKQA